MTKRAPLPAGAALLLLAGWTWGCADARPSRDPDAVDAAIAAAAEPPAARGVVDSLVPIPVALERFREGLEEPTGLRSPYTSRDALVAAYVDILERADTLALEEIAVSRAEYAWLYYPSSIVSRPPYELPPELAWFQLQGENRIGALRALRDLGGRPLEYRGYECLPEPTVEGENRVWAGCVMTVRRNGEPGPAPIKLFGSILERGGRFAILSFANDF